MGRSITIDPITRIEGHLAFRVNIEAGRVTEALCSGEMFRGFEAILRGRHPLDAQQITQRICGVCPISHGIASVLAQEAAYQAQPPRNAILVRNLVQAGNAIMSHLMHFYHLSALDFLDMTAITAYTGRDPQLLALKGWVREQLRSSLLYPVSPFLPRYDGAYVEDAELNILGLKHYVDALHIRAACHKMIALFCGKVPHAATLVPGGVTEHVTVDAIAAYASLLQEVLTFVRTCYVPDVIAVAQQFPDYWALGHGYPHFLAYGAYRDPRTGEHWLPGGAVIDGVLSPVDTEAITEEVLYSRFSSPSGLPPGKGLTVPDARKPDAYSWIKAPRYQGQAMEVGPLARCLIACLHGMQPMCRAVDDAVRQAGRARGDLASVMGRHLARAVEAQVLAEQSLEWIEQLVPDGATFQSVPIPDTGQGVGLTEAPRGALGHWMTLERGVIARYQCVVPTTWNCSPRDDAGNPGVVEHALYGTPVADPENPLEVARVVRAFDPCIACAVH